MKEMNTLNTIALHYASGSLTVIRDQNLFVYCYEISFFDGSITNTKTEQKMLPTKQKSGE